ncbi:metallopeptidase [Schlesneria sp. DSM 10557]|uniref:metallopeptidase n=1 Tax=Schlesneria sp. DSM 10557 TaxID=3044399 RepID=UPI0035C7CD37
MTMTRWFLLPCAIGFATLLAAPVQGEGIKVTNHESGSTIRYPVALLRGELKDRSAKEVVVENRSSQRPSRQIAGVALDGNFRALAELVPGENQLRVSAGSNAIELVLHYHPQTNPYFVRVIYMTDSTGETDYQSQFDGDPQNYADKLDTAIKLLQTFTAERLNDIGLGRHTFNLEFDNRGRIKIHALKGEKPASYYYGLSDNDWYGHVNEWVGHQFPDSHSKNIVIAAYTRFDPVQKKVFAHTALGGGKLGLFGGGSIFTWPNTLQDTFRVFGDETPIDAEKVHEDSAGRKTVWATAATTMGATLHEMGHAFGLPHCTDNLCIMTRGFDHLNRAFTLIEPRSQHNEQPIPFADRDVAYFAPVSAASLRASRWFQLDERRYGTEQKWPTFRLDRSTGNLRVRAERGVRYVSFSVNDDARGFRDFWSEGTSPPKEVVLSADEIRQLAPGKDWTVNAIDDEGESRSQSLSQLQQAGNFIRTWRFAKKWLPWTDHQQFPAATSSTLTEIQRKALAAPVVESDEALIDFEPHFPKENRVNVAGYAALKFNSPERQTVKLLTGSDDGLRIWLNGHIVQEKLALRSARPDDDEASIELRKGANLFLVEVSQATGGWALYFRLVDAESRPLLIDSKGNLMPQAESPAVPVQ